MKVLSGIKNAVWQTMGIKKYNGHNKREHYRIVYPINCRPRLIMFDTEYEAIDISEKGIRFIGNALHEFQIGSEVQFKVIFSDGESLELDGKVLRVSNKQTIIHLSVSIPFMRIAQEQRYIRDKYTNWFQE